MADISIVITLTGPEESLLPAVDAFAGAYGWTPTVVRNINGMDTEVPNPITSAMASREPVRAYFMQTVQAALVAEAQKAAADAAATQVLGAMDTITMTLTVE